ncbi:T9SS type A sorting domain-containing protein, partial [Parabacteroides distasonis]|nr:T9SS type A sorting domain-containing protein [Parabacteroides distasonis]
IQPRIFSNEVQIQNYQQLKSLEIYRADGKLIRSVPQPGSSLSTGDFATGMYIFRLTTEKGSQTVQGIKK